MRKMSNYGKIPTAIICRFGELTKTEIIVLSFLYASRNETTGQCNPSRSRISEATKIAKTHLSTALKVLGLRGYVTETRDGHFALHDEPQEVTESVTQEEPEKLPNREQIVRESVTKVTNPVTESYGIGNSYIKDKNNEGTEKEQRKEQGAPEPLDEFLSTFPDVRLTSGQIGLIESGVGLSAPERSAWTATLHLYLGNRNAATNKYNPGNVGTVLKIYKDNLAEIERNANSKTFNTGRRSVTSNTGQNTSTSDFLASIGANPLSM